MARVIVVGAGNAGLSAAISAHQQGADVTVIDRGPAGGSGSDSFYTGGLFRVSYHSLAELEAIVGPLGMDASTGIERYSSYTEGDFLDDWARVTGYRFDVDLAEKIVADSYEGMTWLAEQGVPFLSGIIVDAKGQARHSRPGWHGGFVEVSGGGPGLMRGLLGAAARCGFPIHSDTEALELEPAEGSRSVKVHARNGDGERRLHEADTVILASGGFQADSEWRTRCLGPGWDLARVRASPFNTGGGIRMAMALGATPHGNWSGAHAVAWSVGSGEAGDPSTNHIFERESYPFGITINSEGVRFIDEGSDFGAYTYARYGREILRQPEQRAWQLFDARTAEHLMDEYRQRNPHAAREREQSLAALAKRLSDRGADGERMLRTVAEFNDAVEESREFNPYAKDGRHTSGLAIEKTNWAQALREPPFEAYEVTCGITFTFGGVRVNEEGAVLDAAKRPLPGVYAAGEMVGGLYYFNYASGTGLTSGAVMGRRAGAAAAVA
ncbi:MAG: FAD-dependent tricarballylate dehydrogenase TcuA [Solirubrobacteraceae bacterium]